MRKLVVSRVLLAASAAALIVSSCGRDSGTGNVPEVPPGGAIAGIYVEAPSGSDDARPVADVRIGLFTQEFNPGMLMYSPPAPIAQAGTDRDGTFRFDAVEPGRYFVVPVDAEAVVVGRWVTVGADRGASVRLTGCTDCPALA